MSLLILATIVVLVLALVAHFTKSSAYPVAIGWLIGALGFGLLYTGTLNDFSALIAVASITSLGALPVLKGDHAGRSFLFGSVPSLTLLSLSFLIGEIPSPSSTTGIVLATAFASAILGSLACLSAASSYSDSGLPSSWMLGIAGSVAGVLSAGQGRSSLPESAYGFPIRSHHDGLIATPVEFVVDGFRGLEEGMRFAASTPLQTLEWAWIGLALICLIGGLIYFPPRIVQKGRMVFVFLAACTTGIIAAYLPALISNLKLPESGPYRDYAQQILIAKNLPGQVADDAHFSSAKNLSLSFVDILPELWTISFALLILVVFFLSRFLSKKAGENIGEKDVGEERMTLMIRASIWLWSAWFIVQVIHRSMYGTAGIGSSNEWIFVGAAIFVTGLSVLSNMKGRSWMRAFSELTPGLGLAIIFLLFGIAAKYDALLGFSMTVF